MIWVMLVRHSYCFVCEHHVKESQQEHDVKKFCPCNTVTQHKTHHPPPNREASKLTPMIVPLEWVPAPSRARARPRKLPCASCSPASQEEHVDLVHKSRRDGERPARGETERSLAGDGWSPERRTVSSISNSSQMSSQSREHVGQSNTTNTIVCRTVLVVVGLETFQLKRSQGSEPAKK